jgi:hypothetical protein
MEINDNENIERDQKIEIARKKREIEREKQEKL